MGNSVSDREEKESEFGEELYHIVRKHYPESCNNITGALLELEFMELERLLKASDRTELENAIHYVASMLFTTSDRTEDAAMGNSTHESFHQQKVRSHHMQQPEEVDKLPDNCQNKGLQFYTTNFNNVDNAPTSNNISKSKLDLGEKLHHLIEKQHPDNADKITGMLLEIDNQTLSKLVVNPDCLERKVNEALAAIEKYSGHPENGLPVSAGYLDEKTVLGEQLYELVYALNPDQAEQITGMLLELELTHLEVLLKDQMALEEKVLQAAEALNGPGQSQDGMSASKSSPLKDDDRKSHVGEQLYHLIFEWHPNQADRITGMLLELDLHTLDLLLEDLPSLQEKANQAARALVGENSGKEIPTEHAFSGESEEDQMALEEKVQEECKLNCTSDSKVRDVLGVKLFSVIEQWHPMEAEKLTGILMDLDCESLHVLVQNHDLLKEKVELALDTLGISRRNRATNQNSNSTIREDLAEKLYEKVEERHLRNADVITGMLLELREEDIKLLLNDPRLLEEKIQLAEQALF